MTFLAVNSLIYGCVLRLYPRDLREGFGADMAEAFGEDLRCAWGAEGLPGVLSVWWYTLVELICVGLPAHAGNHAVVVPVVAFAFTTCLTTMEFAVVYVSHGMGRQVLQDPVLAGILIPGLVTALTAFVWVLCGDYDVLTSLELGSCSKPAI